MTEAELKSEIRWLNRLLAQAAKKAAAQYILIDKLTAAHLRVQTLMKKLGER